MTEQLQLVAVPAPDQTVKLTGRQQMVVEAVHAAGIDGLDADQAGALLHEQKTGRWQHSRDDRCDWCGRDGNAILKRLRELGRVRYRRKTTVLPAGWILPEYVGKKPPRPAIKGWGEFPEGY